jgi:hypothetical protein
LGESASSPWWRTQFLSEAGLRTTSRLFPRTTIGAAVAATTLAARGEHDRQVGTAGRFHLFRLPGHEENLIRQSLQADGTAEQIRGVLASSVKEKLTTLEALCGQARRPSATGPVMIGPIGLLSAADRACQELAACYLAAFRDGTKAFPFLQDTGPAQR